MPLPVKYPNVLITIADHLIKRRFDLKLSQLQVAKIIGVSTDSITYWENKRSEPQVYLYKKVIEFLGYNPYEIDIKTFGDRVKHYRLLNSLSQKRLAKLIDVDPSTIKSLEENKSKLHKESGRKIANYFKTIL